ncbi:hypothetical protein FB451DRAFT_1177525 [Mycena latifolia]|nr:hypothetical protein FB451DRAFT_1177525 [Mycena latifolia]
MFEQAGLGPKSPPEQDCSHREAQFIQEIFKASPFELSRSCTNCFAPLPDRQKLDDLLAFLLYADVLEGGRCGERNKPQADRTGKVRQVGEARRFRLDLSPQVLIYADQGFVALPSCEVDELRHGAQDLSKVLDGKGTRRTPMLSVVGERGPKEALFDVEGAKLRKERKEANTGEGPQREASSWVGGRIFHQVEKPEVGRKIAARRCWDTMRHPPSVGVAIRDNVKGGSKDTNKFRGRWARAGLCLKWSAPDTVMDKSPHAMSRKTTSPAKQANERQTSRRDFNVHMEALFESRGEMEALLRLIRCGLKLDLHSWTLFFRGCRAVIGATSGPDQMQVIETGLNVAARGFGVQQPSRALKGRKRKGLRNQFKFGGVEFRVTKKGVGFDAQLETVTLKRLELAKKAIGFGGTSTDEENSTTRRRWRWKTEEKGEARYGNQSLSQ